MHMDFRHVGIHKMGVFAKSMKQRFINCNYRNSHTHTHIQTHMFNDTDTRFTFQKLIIIVFTQAKK